MVQVGNETTPGMLMHVPGPSTDCWGNNPQNAPIGGSSANWANLAALLTAGIEGVREVDARIPVMLHIENTDDLEGVRWWVDNAFSRGVAFDVLGLSCYTAFQGQPSVWQNTFNDLATRYPNLKFVIAEYNPNRTQVNTIMKNLPNGRGLGTFFWEPTRSGEWGRRCSPIKATLPWRIAPTSPSTTLSAHSSASDAGQTLVCRAEGVSSRPATDRICGSREPRHGSARFAR